jgi:hypothetical protein
VPNTKESGREPLVGEVIEDLQAEVWRLTAERDALLLVAEAVVNGEWEAARELADAALERPE